MSASDSAPGSLAAKRREQNKKAAEQRRHARYGMRFPVTLTFEDGEVVQGFSEDVSLTGFFVVTRLVEGASFLDRFGKGTIELGKDRYTFQCRVARQTAQGIGVLLTKDYAILGYAITRYVFDGISSLRLT
ncbi:MAG: PilZ domain-containing protein [Magnetococcales bacterium]|nr:PilZ domain-containing protein [Magnetococcales bacterium]